MKIMADQLLKKEMDVLDGYDFIAYYDEETFRRGERALLKSCLNKGYIVPLTEIEVKLISDTSTCLDFGYKITPGFKEASRMDLNKLSVYSEIFEYFGFENVRSFSQTGVYKMWKIVILKLLQLPESKVKQLLVLTKLGE
jgi:hypothetical protein